MVYYMSLLIVLPQGVSRTFLTKAIVNFLDLPELLPTLYILNLVMI